MEFEKSTKDTAPATRMATKTDLTDITLLGTPRPQASSTERKTTIGINRILSRIDLDEQKKFTLGNESNSLLMSEDSSLGILQNLSSLLDDSEMMEKDRRLSADKYKINTQRELARGLLEKCSAQESLSALSNISDMEKENDANQHNLITPDILIDSGQHSFNQSSTLKENTQSAGNEGSIAKDLVFEPKEITARSSAMSKSSEESPQTSASQSTGGISFNTTAAELMAQFGDEDFQPGSQAASRILADELSWQQNYSYAMPMASASDNERLELSCFSGIIGDLNLTTDSYGGNRISIGEFFRRKCGSIGELQGFSDRPSFGAPIVSPKRDGKTRPLVEDTSSTGEASITVPSMTKDKDKTDCTKEHSLMSLSSIAQVLKDVDNGTPRRLVDQLIMAKKKTKRSEASTEKFRGDTYTLLPPTRSSLPNSSVKRFENPERDTTSSYQFPKYSLDGNLMQEQKDASKKLTLPSNTFIRPKESTSAQNSLLDVKSSKEPKETPKLLSYSRDNNHENSVQPRSSSIKEKSTRDIKRSFLEEIRVKKERSLGEEKFEANTSGPRNISSQKLNENNIIVKGTQDRNICVVGVPRQVGIEFQNKGDRWIMCSVAVYLIQDNKESIQLNLPLDKILIEPNASKSVKFGVTVTQMSKPIIVILNVSTSDMVTRSTWGSNHLMMCFVPEEPHIGISIHPGKEALELLNFQTVAEKSQKTLPIILENKNNADLPLKLCLSFPHNSPKLFSIENLGNTISSEDNSEVKYLVLQPKQLVTVYIQLKGVPLTSLSGVTKKELFCTKANLIVRLDINKDEGPVMREVPLIGYIGTCKLETIDTQLPIIIPKDQSKPLNLLNAGNVAALVSASIVQSDNSHETSKYFCVEPENVFLQNGEKGTLLITYKPHGDETAEKHASIKVTANGEEFFYPVIGEITQAKESPTQETEHGSDNILRCDTPQHMAPLTSPNSPHSSVSNRSGNYGRNSPHLSSTSSNAVPTNVLPLRATHTALVWSSVKTGKSDIKDFTIRNTSENKIKLQANIVDEHNSFKFLKEHQTFSTSIVLPLQSKESRTLSVLFGPNNPGAAAGKIIFRHYNRKKDREEAGPTRAIFLYGYGGTAKVEISEAFKDVGGRMLLSLGRLNSDGVLDAQIKLQNTGDLCSFAKIKLTPKALYPEMVSSWHIDPDELLLGPGEVQWVRLEFQPKREDLALLLCREVSVVGTLSITHGDEPSRWRIRRLYNKIKQTGELDGRECEAFRNIIYPICKIFPGEAIIQDLGVIRDGVQNLGDLCRGVQQQEVTLTMEASTDDSMSVFNEADETQMFHSLYSDDTLVNTTTISESFIHSETVTDSRRNRARLPCEDNFTVRPAFVTLAPPYRNDATIMVSTTCNAAQPFEAVVSNTEYLSVVPSEGIIPPGRCLPLNIQCKKQIDHTFEARLEVYIENDKREVSIKVTCSE